MHITRVLLNSNAARLTLFTRANCGLCDTAKLTVSKLQKRRPFDYTEVDIMVPENKQWKDVYEFDVPVLHVQPPQSDKESELRKLFHRFSEAEVEKLVTEAERALLGRIPASDMPTTTHLGYSATVSIDACATIAGQSPISSYSLTKPGVLFTTTNGSRTACHLQHEPSAFESSWA